MKDRHLNKGPAEMIIATYNVHLYTDKIIQGPDTDFCTSFIVLGLAKHNKYGTINVMM